MGELLIAAPAALTADGLFFRGILDLASLLVFSAILAMYFLGYSHGAKDREVAEGGGADF